MFTGTDRFEAIQPYLAGKKVLDIGAATGMSHARIVAVADSTYAALEFLAACRAWRDPVTVVTRLRLDGLVKAERRGHFAYYSLTDTVAKEIVATLYRHYCAKGLIPEQI